MTRLHYRIASAGEHPALEDLAAYHEERLSLEEAERIKSHLIQCSDCAGVVLDLSEVAALESDSAAVVTIEVANSWERLHEAIDQEGLWLPGRAAAAEGSNRWKALALAASVTAVLFGGMSGWLWRESSTHVPPQVDPPWAGLAPEGDLRSSGPDEYQELVLPPGVRGWISLAFSAPDTIAVLQVRFFPVSGSEETWCWSGPRPKDPRILRMEITSREIPPGDYRIELSGRPRADDLFMPIARYFLRVAERERP